MMLKLIKPSTEFKNSYINACEEGFIHGFNTESDFINNLKDNFDKFLQEEFYKDFKPKQILCEDGKYYDKVPQTSFWLVEGKEFIGQFDLRHYLTPFLLYKSGHIAYGIRISQRKKGYATKGLRLLLKEAKKLGLKKVMVAAKEENIGSWKAIEKNGGVLENKITMPWNPTGPVYKRYWIDL